MDFTLNGKYNSAKVFADTADESCISQLINLLNQPFTQGSKIRIMPDCHAGSGCVIGTTMTITDSLVPNLVGVDIGCGMLAMKIDSHTPDLEKLDEIINQYIPTGEKHPKAVAHDAELKDLFCRKIHVEAAERSLGTLGGGNHFIELDRDSQGDFWLVIHSGSRHLGIEICNFYQNAGYLALKFEANGGNLETKSAELIRNLKSSGRSGMIESELKRFRKEYREVEPHIPQELCYCSGTLMEEYLHDMGITQRFAKINRQTMAGIILKRMGWRAVDSMDTIHNYIDLERRILRKGSVSAQAGERILIPLNMRDGSLICVGKGNPDWNYSAPHGAGRLYSRSQIKQMFDSELTMEDFIETMKGIYSSSICAGTVDESPWAYKSAASIIENIKDTADIEDHLIPVYNFKAHEQGLTRNFG